MPRAKQNEGPIELPADPGLVELELGKWAGERVARAGRRDALLGRVELLRLSLDGRSVEARVRGNRPLPYNVRVVVDNSEPTPRCSCSTADAGPCRHAVAALEALRFPRPVAGAANRKRTKRRTRAGTGRIIQHAPPAPGFVLIGGAERTLPREERIAAVREDERAARRNQARRDRAIVEPRVESTSPLRFLVTPRRAGDPHTVTLRAADGGRAGCSCDDFGSNELQTCRHVERVRIWMSRQRKAERPVAPHLASLWCEPRIWLDRAPDPLREIRLDLPRDERPAVLDRYYEESGWLRPAPRGHRPSVWSARARDVARRYARRREWPWDLDREVGRRIAEAASLEDHGAEDSVVEEVVGGLGLRLHPYQEHGVRMLARLRRSFLADDMGLGKTVQAIGAALVLRQTRGVRRALVVCPASLKYQWRREIHKVCGEQARVVEGNRAHREETYAAWRSGFLVLNYELLLRDLAPIRAARADLVVLDEAQRIKNWNTQTARAVKQLDGEYAFVLTGTPLENRLVELHSLVEFLHPRALGPRWRLFPFHAVTDAQGRVLAYEALDVLRRRLSGFFLRRERRKVMDQLPERTENTFWTDMTGAQRRPYRRHAAVVRSLIGRSDGLRPEEIRALFRSLTAMRILCNAHAQYAWDEKRWSATAPGRDLRSLGSPKLEEFSRVLEDLLDESNEKIVVFSQWHRMLKLAHWALRGSLERRDLRGEMFHGGLNSRAREEMIDAFREDPEFRVLFSTDAGGLGLNLQDAASIVVNLEVPWNPAVLEQRIGRVHRMGQRRSVQVMHFVTRGALEERVRQVVEEKRALFDGLLADEADIVVFDSGARASFVDRVRRLF